jgi:methionine synthase II (cobalamin-independent)
VSPQRSRDAYSDPFELFADGLLLMREEAEELARMGCRYIQVDAPDFGQLVDQAQREAWERAGISVDRVFSEGADMLNAVAGIRMVALGLVSSKFDRLEPAEALVERIREASRFFPREQLALSTQCGFASAGPGNAISEGAQENKLRLVGEVADRVWGGS